MSDVDIDHLRSWIGRTQEKTDTITPRLVESFNSIFEASSELEPGDSAPLGIHWCLAPDIVPINELGPDGHPARGGFLPPVPLPRRMWAGGEVHFETPFQLGDTVTKHSRIEDVSAKAGRSGSLVFVTVRHEYLTPRGLALHERQDIVYRDQVGRPAQVPSGRSHDHQAAQSSSSEVTRTLVASTPLLFRYSALTFNGHRIHYDLPYTTQEENYPGLVFHGPLQATLLMQLAADVSPEPLQSFAYRSVAPLFAGAMISLHAKHSDTGRDLWVADHQGLPTMKATIGSTGG
ncbi:MaoC family dehydratase N-terminal domain-containing protein [Hoeflea sp.]|uniref:FAS1-like dehydratase domain-containing protein n=1 Tax=Hoeflea sp. TaxID=1940281 RepID=UPI0037488AB6